MKKQIWIRWLWLLAFLISGCASSSQAASPAPTTEPLAVEDKASLIAALEAAGGTVETGEPISQDFFIPEGSILKVNGADIQVFEYSSGEEMEDESSQVSPDGGSIGASMLMWVDAPHFYKLGRIIVLYVGSDATVLDLLETTLGQQFAGRYSHSLSKNGSLLARRLPFLSVGLYLRNKMDRWDTEYIYNWTLRRSWVLRATTIVLTDISKAPTAGESRMPQLASTPAASGMVTIL